MKQAQLDEAKPVSSPGTRDEGRHSDDCDMPLNEKDTTNYRAIVARCNYLAPDRPDVAYAVKELARAMSKPTKGGLQRFKRLGRYLKGKPRLVLQYGWQAMPTTPIIYSDADWAGCRNIRNSTTGGCMMIGGHCVKGWSKTQSLVALSSGESEMYAALKASAETLGLLAMLKDLGRRLHGEIWGDANAALDILNRCGFEKIRHIDTSLLRIQQVAAEQRLKYRKVLGTNNPADLFTKHLDEKSSSLHVSNLGLKALGGRAADAPQLHVISISMDEHQNGGNHGEWEWLQYLWSEKHKQARGGGTRTKADAINMVSGLRHKTNAVSQVL